MPKKEKKVKKVWIKPATDQKIPYPVTGFPMPGPLQFVTGPIEVDLTEHNNYWLRLLRPRGGKARRKAGNAKALMVRCSAPTKAEESKPKPNKDKRG